jgi:hypothetical protein
MGFSLEGGSPAGPRTERVASVEERGHVVSSLPTSARRHCSAAFVQALRLRDPRR